MSVTTVNRGSKKNSSKSKPRQKRRTATRTSAASNGDSKMAHANGIGKTYHKQNDIYDGTGRLYECMSVAELNIRLRNLADHCLATHKGNAQQRENLLHEIKDIQKTMQQVLAELNEQVMGQIKDLAAKSGDQAGRIAELLKQIERLELDLKLEKDKTGGTCTDDELKAVKQEGIKRAQRLQKEKNLAESERDNFRDQLQKAQKYSRGKDNKIEEMGGQLRGMESERDDWKLKYESAQKQNKSRRKSLSNQDSKYEATIEDWKDKHKALSQELADAKAEAATKEASIAGLQAEHAALNAKIANQMNKHFADFVKNVGKNQALELNLAETQKFYEKRMKEIHELWEESSKQIKDLYTKNYIDLKERIEHSHDQALQRCAELEARNKELTQRVNTLNDEKMETAKQLQRADKVNSKQGNKLNELRARIKKQNDELVAMQVKISQYRVIWNHYMMLEGKLKNEIGHLDNSVATFEDQMQVEPPMPKRRRVRLGAIREYSNGLHLPLELSEVPIPELIYNEHHLGQRKTSKPNKSDVDNKRFFLVNSSRSSHFTLLGVWYLVNDRGDKIALPHDLALAPGRRIGFCMGNEKVSEDDVLLNENRPKNEGFISFAKPTDRLFLEDRTGGQMPLFAPSLLQHGEDEKEEDLDNGTGLEGGYIEHAPRLKSYLDLQELVRIADKPYFVLVNVTANPIMLRGFKLRREHGKFSMPFPEIEMVQGHPVRFLFAKKKEYDNDILIKPRNFGPVNQQDNLFLEDKFGKRHHLISNLPSPPRAEFTHKPPDDACFVM